MESRMLESQALVSSQSVAGCLAGRDRALLAEVELRRQGTHTPEVEGTFHADGCTGDSWTPHNWAVSRISTLCYVH